MHYLPEEVRHGWQAAVAGLRALLCGRDKKQRPKELDVRCAMRYAKALRCRKVCSTPGNRCVHVSGAQRSRTMTEEGREGGRGCVPTRTCVFKAGIST